ILTSGVVSGAPAFGQLDSPLQNATRVTGVIAGSGWALDDRGVTSVMVYRNCVPFEDQANCQLLGGSSVVYLGDATLAVGARPDIERAFPAYPGAARAGWA